MAVSATVFQRKQIKRKAPRGFLRRVFKRQKPHLRLETRGDVLVSARSPGWAVFGFKNPFIFSLLKIHLNCLLFIHRLAEEARINTCENKCGIIKKDHVLAAAKV
ncbi:Centromere protein W, partial [Heterocephalus glaber]